MNYWLIVLPFIAAAIGWLMNRLFITFMFRQFKRSLPQIATALGRIASNNISFQQLESKIVNPENVQKLLPLIEGHLDHFLREKLSKEMPVISMFIGDKTINQLKTVFVKELQDLFPVIMKNYIGNLEQDLNIEQLVADKINAIEPEQAIQSVHLSLSKQLRLFEWFGAATGFIIGLVQVLLTVLFLR